MDGSRAAATSSQAGGAQFPAGLRVLVVDDDPTFLKILEQKLRHCLYDVTTCQRAEIALSMLREKKDGFDLVLSDVHMPDMDGFKLLELIGLEMDLPVIMMSVDDGKDLVMKGVKHGACDYLIKPVRIEALKNIWQHVVRRKKNEFMDNDIKDLEQSGSVEETDKLRKSSDDGEYTSSANEANWKTVKKRKEDNEEDDDTEEREDSSTLKKPRVVWSVDLHQQFVAAVNRLGIDKAVPKKILELMNVPGLTRENVASHLQKFRLYLRRVSAPQHQARNDIHLTATKEAAAYGSFGSLEGVDLQALAGSCQLTPQAFAAYQTGPRRIANTGVPITDQMNFFNFDGQVLNYSKMRAPSANEWNNRQMNSRDGPSAGMVPRQLGQPPQMVQSYGNMGLHVNRGTSSFSQPLPSSGVSSLVHSGTSGGHQTNTLVTQMTQQGHHFSLSQQQNHLNMDMSKQPQSTGLLLNGIAAQCDSRLSSSIKQQVLPNEISDQVYRRSGTTITADSLISGTYINTSNSAMSQASYPNFQNGGMIQSVGKGYPHVSAVDSTLASSNVFQGPVPTIGSLQANSVAFKMSKDLAPSFDPLSEICQNQNQGWKLQNTNLPYDSVQHLGSKQSNIDFSPTLSTHQDLVSALKDGNSRNTHRVSKDILSVRTEIESGTVECVSQHNSAILLENSARLKAKSVPNTSYQDMPFDDVVIPNELMNIIGEQRQEGAGQVDTDFNFDGYHLDNISV